MKLTTKNDAYGQEILAALEGKKSYEIVEREDGYFSISGGSGNYFAEYKDFPQHEKKAFKFVKGKILDVGIGAGRVALYFQKKGFDVIGIDNSPLAIKVCKKRGVKKAKVLGIEQINLLKEKFDTVIMTGNNFGLFANKKKTKVLLKKIYKITSKKAIIIAESNDPYKTNDKNHLDYIKINQKKGKMGGQLKIRIRFEKFVGPWFEYLLVSKKEMNELLNQSGWRVKKFIDNPKRSTYIAIIEKIVDQ
jgi:SAM-dependent methyltransferase